MTTTQISLCFFALSLSVSSAVNVLTENFNYPDGALVPGSSGLWTTHSGTTGQVDVVSNAAFITSAESEDVSARVASTGFGYDSGVLTANARVNFSALPAGTGGYFMHFRDGGTGFRGRVYATITGAAAGSFRLGIANASNSVFTPIATDLAIGTAYNLTLTMNAASGVSGLSINGGAVTLASDPNDVPLPVIVQSFSLRQSLASGNGMGSLTVDNILVDASAPAIAVPEASISGLALLAAFGLMRRRR